MKLSIPDMSCAHCRAVVEKTIAAQAGTARIVVDLDSRTVEVASASAIEPILKALAAEGYPASVAG